MEKLVTLTTGDIANYLNVNYVTVIRWIKRGKLKAHKLPVRGDRRIEVHDFLDFLRENDMPIPDDLKSFLHRVLIIADDAELISATRLLLVKYGYEVKTAHNAFRAGQLVGAFRPSVIVLNLSVPGMNALGVLQQLRSEEEPSPARILVVSEATDHAFSKALDTGADDYLHMPFKSEELIEKINVLANIHPHRLNTVG